MAGRILREDVETLRRQADIVQVVGDYTTLKRAGASFKGLCPFHTEKSPSFNVKPGDNFFHCFGCGASGDLYDFLQRVEGLDFPEAVESLARRTGYTLRYEELSAKDRRALGKRTKLVDVTAAAAAWFERTLYGDEGQVARDYLKARGFGREDARTFGLGFAPNRWDALSIALRDDGIRAEDLIETGLAVRNDRGGLRDRFRGRLIFPIHDPGGDVIGFGGRILDALDYGDFDPPKYLNSAETPLYKKTRVLYGVPQARAEIVRAESVLICEGYTDVMGLHKAGFANAVATCGTAVGVEHLRAVARYAGRVVLAFDGDAAGVKAAERAWEAAVQLGAAGGSSGGATGVELAVLALPDGMDPADAAEAYGAEGVRDLVDQALPVVPFVLRHRLADADLSSEAGRTAALREALDVLRREPDPDLRREWARTEIAATIGVAYDFVARSAARAGIELDRHEGVAAGGGRGRAAPSGEASPAHATARRERDVLRVALQAPELLPDEWYELGAEDFTHPVANAVFATIEAAGGAGVDTAAIVEAASDDELRTTIRGLVIEQEPVPVDAELAAWRVRTLVARRIEAEAARLRGRLQTLSHGRDLDELRAVQRELASLEQRRRALTEVVDAD